MAEERVIKIVVDSGQAKKSTKELTDEISEQKKILIELEKELYKVDVALKNTSKGNLSAQKSLRDQSTHLKDSIKDQKIALKELGLEKSNSIKIDKETNLSYVESTKLVALLDNVTDGYASKFVKLYKGFDAGVKSVKGFNNGLSSMKKALISTGIGALVVALGLVVAYWDEIVAFITKANEKLQKQIDLNKDNVTQLNFEIKLLDAKAKILDAEGKSTVEINKQKEKVLKLLLLENDQLITNLKTQLKRETSQAKELSFFQKLVQLRSNYRLIGEIDAEEKTRLDEINKSIQDATINAETLKLNLIEINKPEDKKKELSKKDTSVEDAEFANQEKINAIREKFRLQNEDAEDETEFEKLQRRYERDLLDLERLGSSEEQKIELEKYYTDLRTQQEADAIHYIEQLEIDAEDARLVRQEKELADAKKLADESLKIEQQSDDEKKKSAEALENFKASLAQGGLNLLGELAKRGSAIAKGVAIAQAGISTYQGINKALAETTDFTPTQSLRFANAALVGVAGFANMANILKTNEMGQVGFGASANNAQPQTSAPSFNLVQGTGSNQVAETINQNQRPIQAFVVGSNVTSQQELDRRRVANSTI
jgi:hypothetical protein